MFKRNDACSGRIASLKIICCCRRLCAFLLAICCAEGRPHCDMRSCKRRAFGSHRLVEESSESSSHPLQEAVWNTRAGLLFIRSALLLSSHLTVAFRMCVLTIRLFSRLFQKIMGVVPSALRILVGVFAFDDFRTEVEGYIWNCCSRGALFRDLRSLVG